MAIVNYIKDTPNTVLVSRACATLIASTALALTYATMFL